MSRTDGFAVMDVSTDIVNDPKFRRLQREHPGQVGIAFLAYIAILSESWKAGRRVTVLDAWPSFVPYESAAAGFLRDVGLLDRRGMVPAKTWDGWFSAAHERREKARDRWRRANERRVHPSTDVSVVTASGPRGSRDVTRVVPRGSVTAPSVPSVPSRPAPTEDARDERYDAPETEALQWLARHGVALAETNGIRRKLIEIVEKFGTNAVIGKFDRLSAAGILDGDGRGFVFGASNELYPKADLQALEREERVESSAASFNRGVERTHRMLREMRGGA